MNFVHGLDAKVRQGIATVASAVRPPDAVALKLKAAEGFLKELTLGDYTLKPLDAVLFAGTDPVATFIKRIELHEVVPRVTEPFHELWTHAGILIDKSVLPLPFLEEGKMYLYESVFSGTVFGYTYSNVLPEDHAVPKGGNHLGPQIRDFEAVVNEGTINVGICPLTDEQRKFAEQRLKENPDLLVHLYYKYKDFGFVASASEHLRHDLSLIATFAKDHFGLHEPKKDSVFCSEFVSIIYRTIGFKTFSSERSPETFTPLDLEVSAEFGSNVFYAKENNSENRRIVGFGAPVLHLTEFLSATQAQKLVKSLALNATWVHMNPAGGIPPGAQPAGADLDGVNLYIARVKIGSAFYLGKIRHDWTYPMVTYFEREVPINFGHEVLADLKGMVWVDAKNGEVPLKAVKAGIDEDGTFLYIARASVGGHKGILGIGDKEGALTPGTVASHLKSARIPFYGKEVKCDTYQVLCHELI